jgi:hypothetical protein
VAKSLNNGAERAEAETCSRLSLGLMPLRASMRISSAFLRAADRPTSASEPMPIFSCLPAH